ncbi:MAG: prolyl oligopeptidase family serine peptidase [Gemmatales bacterium]
MRLLVSFSFTFIISVSLLAWDGQADNAPDKVRQIPPPGIKINEADRAELTKSVADFEQEIAAVRKELSGQTRLLELFPDVLIYHKAVDWALKYDEFYDAGEGNKAREQLKTGRERLAQLKARKPEWVNDTGLVVRGYISKIDGSVQPYGLVVPDTYTHKTLNNYRLDVWCHGRGEKLTELAFVDQRSKSPGEFTPRDTFVLHPYGRYCCANKFAGEVDLFEALDQCKKHYRIDDKRIVMRGFSMGGAACWQFAVHFPDKWCAAAPGAGFSETPEFLKIFQDEKLQPTWWEKKLWHLYNATDYAENLKHLPTIAYSGEIDKQKQAADVMAREMDRIGLKLKHIIGPKTGHSYHPDAKKEINRRIDKIAEDPSKGYDLAFTTFTLRYSKHDWVQLQELERHWDRARIVAQPDEDDPERLIIKTKNIAAFTIDLESPHPQIMDKPFKTIQIDGVDIGETPVSSDSWLTLHLVKKDGTWEVVSKHDDSKLRKKPGLQGPIDDAFMDSFIIVKPSEKSPHAKVNEWVDAEMNHAIDQWRKQFRGVPRIKLDKEITEADIATNHLILWGVPASNSVIKKIADKLPIKWADGKVKTDKQGYDADTHAPILIYPNPLNPSKYVVLNSGFTFREYAQLNNARQVPMLPDWAIVDITTAPNSQWPGKIVGAGFFGEKWECKEQAKE